MTVKNLVLPLIDSLAAVADWEDGPDIAEAVAKAQRDADLIILERDYVPRERVKALAEAARRIIQKRHDPHYLFRIDYDLKALEEALAQFKEAKL